LPRFFGLEATLLLVISTVCSPSDGKRTDARSWLGQAVIVPLSFDYMGQGISDGPGRGANCADTLHDETIYVAEYLG